MRRVVIANQKGGVGKTATAINVAAVLAQSTRVLAVDVDPQFALTRQLGITTTGPTLVEVLSGGPARDAIVRLDAIGISVLPAHRKLSEVEQALVSQSGREWFLAQALDELADDFDVAIIDTPPNLGQLTVNALVTADLVVVPISLEDEGAAQGVIELEARIGELERVRKIGGREPRPRLLPFYNRSQTVAGGVGADLSNESHPSSGDPAIDQVVAHQRFERFLSARSITEALSDLGIEAAETRIPDRVVVQHAAIARQPIIVYRPDHLAAIAFRELADELQVA